MLNAKTGERSIVMLPLSRACGVTLSYWLITRYRNQQKEKRQSIYDAKLIVSKNDQAVFNSMRVVDMAYRNNWWVHVRHCLNGVEWE